MDKKSNIRKVKSIVRHPAYSWVVPNGKDNYFLNDLSLLELENALEFNQDTAIFPACLIDFKLQQKETDEYVVSGYGLNAKFNQTKFDLKSKQQNVSVNKLIYDLKDKNLMETKVKQSSSTDCKKNMICTINLVHSSQCTADEGSPLLHYDKKNKKLYSIALFSSNVNRKRFGLHCDYNLISRFTLIHPNLQWIYNYTSAENACSSKPIFQTNFNELKNYLIIINISFLVTLMLLFNIKILSKK